MRPSWYFSARVVWLHHASLQHWPLVSLVSPRGQGRGTSPWVSRNKWLRDDEPFQWNSPDVKLAQEPETWTSKNGRNFIKTNRFQGTGAEICFFLPNFWGGRKGFSWRTHKVETANADLILLVPETPPFLGAGRNVKLGTLVPVVVGRSNSQISWKLGSLRKGGTVQLK